MLEHTGVVCPAQNVPGEGMKTSCLMDLICSIPWEKEVNKKLANVVPKQQQIRKELEEIIKELEADYHE